MDRHESTLLIQRLRADARRIAARFGLSYRAIYAEHRNVKARYGHCTSDGVIKIRLAHAVTGRPLKYSSLVDTLCHELAHLRHFDHGDEFKRLFWQLLGWARRQGIYQPSQRRRRGDKAELEIATHPTPATALSRRNGVPVFTRPAAPERHVPAPWERRAAQQQLPLAARAESPRRQRPAARRRPRRHLEPDVQLSLF